MFLWYNVSILRPLKIKTNIKMSASTILYRVLCSVLVGCFSSLLFPATVLSEVLDESKGFVGNDGTLYPYTKTFVISAYYSPLPCQEKYVTGAYESDIRLNGNGVHGADGSDVYPGMIAAPKNYPFGTKMYIPDVGIVAVHDRGGAIVASSGGENSFDRLDIWMGYGDQGLNRALNWGKRKVDVTVYGVNDSIVEQISLSGYSVEEAVPRQCVIDELSETIVEDVAPVSTFVDDGFFHVDLKSGDQGELVTDLQNELKSLNFFKSDLTGVYDELTEHAVLKFQQSQKIVGDEISTGAGTFGPKTREKLNIIVSLRISSKALVAAATAEHDEKLNSVASADPANDVPFSAGFSDSDNVSILLSSELDFGAIGPDVKVLQEFLKDNGFFDGNLVTDYFGPVTRDALIEFQLANKIIESENDVGAGRVGPSTLEIINTLG